MEKRILNLKRSPENKIPISPVKPLPLEDMPMWTKLPYDHKYPLPACSEKFVTLTREELGKSLYQTFPGKAFDLTQSPVPSMEGSTYNSLHDPFLSSYYFRSSSRLRSLMRNGLVTKDGKVKATLQEYNHYRMYLYHLWAMQVNQLNRTQMSEEKNRFKNIFKAQGSEDPLLKDVIDKYEKVNVEQILDEMATKIFQDKEFIIEHGFTPLVRSVIQWKIYQEKLKKNFRNKYSAVKQWLYDQSKHYRHLMEKKLNAQIIRERKMRSRWERICERSRARLEKELKLKELQQERMRRLSVQRYNRAKNQWARNEREIKLRRKKVRQPFTNLDISDDLMLDRVKISEAESGSFKELVTTELDSKTLDGTDLTFVSDETKHFTETSCHYLSSHQPSRKMHTNEEAMADSLAEEDITEDSSHCEKHASYSETDLYEYSDDSEKKLHEESKTRELSQIHHSVKMIKYDENNTSSDPNKRSSKRKKPKLDLHDKNESQTVNAAKHMPKSKECEKPEVRTHDSSRKVKKLGQKSKDKSKDFADKDSNSSDNSTKDVLVISKKHANNKEIKQLKKDPKSNHKIRGKLTSSDDEMTSNNIYSLSKNRHSLISDNTREINNEILKKSDEDIEILNQTEKIEKPNINDQSLPTNKAKEYSLSFNSQAQLVKFLYGLPNLHEFNRTKMENKEYLQTERKDGYSTSVGEKVTYINKSEKPKDSTKEYLPQAYSKDSYLTSDEKKVTYTEKDEKSKVSAKEYLPKTERKDGFSTSDGKRVTDIEKAEKSKDSTRADPPKIERKDSYSISDGKKIIDIDKAEKCKDFIKEYPPRTVRKDGYSMSDGKRVIDIEKAETSKDSIREYQIQIERKDSYSISDGKRITDIEKSEKSQEFTKEYPLQTGRKDGYSVSDGIKLINIEKAEKSKESIKEYMLQTVSKDEYSTSDGEKLTNIENSDKSKDFTKEYLTQTGCKYGYSTSDEEKVTDIEKDEKSKDSTTYFLRTGKSEILQGKKHRNVWKELEISMNDTKRKVQEQLGLRKETLLEEKDRKIWKELCENESFTSTYILSLRKKQVRFEEIPKVHFLDEVKIESYRTDSDNESENESKEAISKRIFGKKTLPKKFNNFFLDEYKMKARQFKQTKPEPFMNISQTNVSISSKMDESVRSEYKRSEIHKYQKKQLDLEFFEAFSERKANLRKTSKIEMYGGTMFEDFNIDKKIVPLETLNKNMRKDNSGLAERTECAYAPYFRPKIIKSKKKRVRFSKYINFKVKNTFSKEKANKGMELKAFDSKEPQNLKYSENYLQKEFKKFTVGELKDTLSKEKDSQEQKEKFDHENIIDKSNIVTKESYGLQTNEQKVKEQCEAQDASDSKSQDPLKLEDYLGQSKIISPDEQKDRLNTVEDRQKQNDSKSAKITTEPYRIQSTEKKMEQQSKTFYRDFQTCPEGTISGQVEFPETETMVKEYDTSVGESNEKNNTAEHEENTVEEKSGRKVFQENETVNQEKMAAIKVNIEKYSCQKDKTAKQDKIAADEKRIEKYSYQEAKNKIFYHDDQTCPDEKAKDSTKEHPPQTESKDLYLTSDGEKVIDIEKSKDSTKEHPPQTDSKDLYSTSDGEKVIDIEKSKDSTKENLAQTERKDGYSTSVGEKVTDIERADKSKDSTKVYLPQTKRKYYYSTSDGERVTHIVKDEKCKDSTIYSLRTGLTEILEGKKHRNLWKELEISINNAKKIIQERHGLSKEILLEEKDRRIWKELCENESYTSTYIRSLRKKQVRFEEIPTVHFLDEVKSYRTDSDTESENESKEVILKRIFGKKRVNKKFNNFFLDEYKMKAQQVKQTKMEPFMNVSQTKMSISSKMDERVRSEYKRSEIHKYRKKKLDLEFFGAFSARKTNLRKTSKTEKYDNIISENFNTDKKICPEGKTSVSDLDLFFKLPESETTVKKYTSVGESNVKNNTADHEEITALEEKSERKIFHEDETVEQDKMAAIKENIKKYSCQKDKTAEQDKIVAVEESTEENLYQKNKNKMFYHNDQTCQERKVSKSDLEFLSQETGTIDKEYNAPLEESVKRISYEEDKNAEDEMATVKEKSEKNQKGKTAAMEEGSWEISQQKDILVEQEVTSDRNIAQSVIDQEMIDSFKKLQHLFSEESTNFLNSICLSDPLAKDKTDEYIEQIEDHEITEDFRSFEYDEKFSCEEDPNNLKKDLRTKIEKKMKLTVEKEDLVRSFEVKIFDTSDKSEQLVNIQPTELIANIESTDIKRNLENLINLNADGRDKHIDKHEINFRTINYEEKDGFDRICEKNLSNILYSNTIVETDLSLPSIKSSDLEYTISEHSDRTNTEIKSEYYQIRSDVLKNYTETKEITDKSILFFDLQEKNTSLDLVPNFIYSKDDNRVKLEDKYTQSFLKSNLENIVIKNIHPDHDIYSGIDKKHQLLEGRSVALTSDEASLDDACKPKDEILNIGDVEAHKIEFEKVTQISLNAKYKSLPESSIESVMQTDLSLTYHQENKSSATQLEQETERMFKPHAVKSFSRTAACCEKSINNQLIPYKAETYMNLNGSCSPPEKQLNQGLNNINPVNDRLNVSELLVNEILRNIVKETFSIEHISKVIQEIAKKNSHSLPQVKMATADQEEIDKIHSDVQSSKLEERKKNEDLDITFIDALESDNDVSEWNVPLLSRKVSDNSFKSITDQGKLSQEEYTVGGNEPFHLKFPVQYLNKKERKQKKLYIPWHSMNKKDEGKKNIFRKIIKPLAKENYDKSDKRQLEYNFDKKSNIVIIEDVKSFTNYPIDPEDKDQVDEIKLRDVQSRLDDDISINNEEVPENYNSCFEETDTLKSSKSNLTEANVMKNFRNTTQ